MKTVYDKMTGAKLGELVEPQFNDARFPADITHFKYTAERPKGVRRFFLVRADRAELRDAKK